jgi:hypothetical protein
MAIRQHPNDHIELVCDLEGCTFQGPLRRGITEDELLDIADAKGWNIDREFGLHYCPLTTMHECSVCGAPTRSAVGPGVTLTERGEFVSSGDGATYYCREHWPL